MKLAAYFLIALVVHGPLSPLLPTAFEAALLYYAKYPAWLLALVGTLGASVAEVANYRLVDWATELPKLATLKDRHVVLVPGLLGAAFGYRKVLPLLAETGSEAIVIEPLGIGGSGCRKA